MRPDRTIVIGHWVVACLAAGHGANSPSGKGFFISERARHALGVVVRRNTREKTMTRIGRPHSARLLTAIQRKRICGKFLTPESLLEPMAQALGLLLQL